MREFLRRTRSLLLQLEGEGRLDERRHAVYRMHLEIGEIQHALGDCAAARDALGRAATWAVRVLEARDPARAAPVRTPRQMIDMCSVVVAFGTLEERRRLVALPRGAWYYPENPYWDATAAAATYLLRALTVGDESALSDALDACAAADDSDSVEVQSAENLLGGLSGILAGDAEETFEGFAGLMRGHWARAAGDWAGTTDALVAWWGTALAVLAAEAGVDVRAASAHLPEAALDLRDDAAWQGPWEDRTTAERALDGALAQLGYRRGGQGNVRRKHALLRVGGSWWIEGDRPVARCLARGREGPSAQFEVSVTGHTERDAHEATLRRLVWVDDDFVARDERETQGFGRRRGDLRATARDAWLSYVEATAPIATVEVLEYSAEPELGDPHLDAVYRCLREADTWEVFIDVEPIELRATRPTRGWIHAIVPEREDWRRIEAKLRET